MRVWALTRDVTAGTRIGTGDLRSVRVRLYDNADSYVSSGTPLAGRHVGRDLRQGDLLPRSALQSTEPAGTVVPLSVGDDTVPPGLRRGDRIDVYASTGKDSGGVSTTYRVLTGVTVDSVDYGNAGALSASNGKVVLTVELEPTCAARGVPRLAGQSLYVVQQRHDGATDACADAAAWPALPVAAVSPPPAR